jgi:putative SOS response-associated peptidase YedK
MCVDIGYKSMLGPDGLPRYIKGIKIDRSLAATDVDAPHLQAHTRPSCVIIKSDLDGLLMVERMSWGLIADFMINNSALFKKYGNQLFNARAEKVLQLGSTWNSLLNNRCLLVADGVYEHQEVPGRKNKLPYYIQPEKKEPLLIPGLYNPHTNSFAIITREGNELFCRIHNSGPNKNRMPLLLSPENAVGWVQEHLTLEEIERFLKFQLPAEELQAHTVFSIRSHLLRSDGKAANEYYNWGAAISGEQASLF